MAKQTSRTISREENNIIYVEPNYEYSTEMYGTNGLNTYEFIPPTEDYSIYVNLKVETRGRTIRTNATNDKNELVLSWETDMSGRTTTNLMEGTRIHVGNKGNYINSLTTNYTDIFIGDWKKKPRATIEMFGINSIDISYNSYMVPEVTIEFTDIRGAAVFGPKEAYETALNDAGVAAKDGNVDVANTFFQCFFTFPYPKFTLLVKGFYGQPVSYELSCADFRARFNSSSGNFDCTAKFVGYHFSFLADVMFNILVAAPYSDYIGEDYWNDHDFRLLNNAGEAGIRMPKLAEVIQQLKYAEDYVARIMQTEPEVQEALVAQASQYNSETVQVAYNRYISSMTERITRRRIGTANEQSNLKLYFEDLNKQGYPMTFVLFTDSSNNDALANYLNCFNETSAAYETLRLAIDEYNETHSSMKIEELDMMPSETEQEAIAINERAEHGEDVTALSGLPNWINGETTFNAATRRASGQEYMAHISLVIKEKPGDNGKAYVDWDSCNVRIPDALKNEIDANVAQGNATEGINPYLEFRNGYIFRCESAEDINNILLVDSKAEENAQKELLKRQKSYLEKVLGWAPSVENMTRIVMAHFQTLAYMIFKTGYDIASENPRRTMSSLGINDADDLSDVPDSQKNTYVPPFPKVTKKTTHQGDVVREETWVGEYKGVGFLEKELVHGLINGVTLAAKKMNESGATMTLEDFNSPSLVQTMSTGAVTTVMPYPICSLDLIAEENIYLDGGHDMNDVSSVLGLVALRGINALMVSSDVYNLSTWAKIDISKAKLLGKLEWINYLKLNGGSLSSEMNQKLAAVKQNPDAIIQMLEGIESDVIKKPEGGWPWDAGTDNAVLGNISSGIIDDEGTFKLFTTEYEYTLPSNIGNINATATVFPYESLGWNRNNSDVYDSNVGLHSESYINTNIGYSKKNVFVFDTNINRFYEIAQNQFGHATADNAPEGTLELKELLEDHKQSDYWKLYVNHCLREKRLIEGGEVEYSGSFNAAQELVSSEFREAKYKELYKDLEKQEVDLDFTNLNEMLVFILDFEDKVVSTENSGMLPTSSSLAKKIAENEAGKSTGDKTIGRGYNMNYLNETSPGTGGQGIIVNDWYYADGTNVYRKSGPNGESAINCYIQNLNDHDMTLTEFPGITNFAIPMWNKGGIGTSIFCQRLYYLQDSDYAKGLLFLLSLGHIYDYNKIAASYFASPSREPFVIPLAAVMFFGGIMWYYREDDANLELVTLDFYGPVFDIISDLNEDVIAKFIKTFKDWVRVGVDGNSLLRPFNEFSKGLELTIKEESTFYDLDDFFELLDEPEDGQSWVEDAGYSSCLELLADTFTDDFFRNYIAIDEDHYGNFEDGTKGFRVGNRDGAPAIMDAVNFALAGCVFFFETQFADEASEYIEKSDIHSFLKAFFEGFLDDIKETDTPTALDLHSTAKVPEHTTDDIKVGVYRYCKLLYDKWLGGISMEEFEDNWTMPRFFEREDKYFHFIDAYYNLSNYIPINIGHFAESIVGCFSTDSQYHLLSFLSNMYSHNKFNFLCIQNFIDLSDPNNMKTMFDLIPYTHSWHIKENPNFIVMYPYEASSHLEIENGQYENDSFMINDTFNKHKWPEPLKSRSAGTTRGYKVPAFGVSFGRLYQSYFKDIDVGMDNPVVTEQSIKAQYQIACNEIEAKDKGGTAKVYTYGQDLYAIYSNNSYTCNVTMMGCAWVQPLMYFVLNNVPMFRGTYLIEKVTHHIEPGNMTTKFMGVRMANVANRITVEQYAYSAPTQTGDGSMEQQNRISEAQNRLADIDNDCPYKIYPLTEDEMAISASRTIKDVIAAIKKWEGGYAGNIDGMTCTMKGITLATFRSFYGQDKNCEDLRNITDEQWYHVFKNGFWDKWRADEIKNGSIAHLLVDWFWGSGYYGMYYPQEVLGEPRSTTITDAVINKINSSDSRDLFTRLWNRRKAHFESIAKCNQEPKGEKCKFLKGWLNRLNDIQYSPDSNEQAEQVEPAKVEENGDKHIEDIAVNFLNALDRTCASTASNIKLATDQSKSSVNTIWIQPSDKTITNFSKVFDIIVNGYGSKVEEVRWVVAQGQDLKSEPIAYLVTVKDGVTVTKVHVVYENDLNTRVSLPISEGDSGSTVNTNFCKTLRKKYNPKNISNTTDNNNTAIIENAKHRLRSDVDNTIDDEGATVIITSDSYKMKDCGTVLSENGFDMDVAMAGERPTGKWPESCDAMAKWYEQNVHTYQGSIVKKPRPGRKNYECPLVTDGPVQDDCSAFVSACLRAFGLTGFGNQSSYSFTHSQAIADKLAQAGFKKMAFSREALTPYDIVTVNIPNSHHHVEIYLGEINGRKKAYGWGSVHDGRAKPNSSDGECSNCGTFQGMPCSYNDWTYNYIYRYTGGTATQQEEPQQT